MNEISLMDEDTTFRQWVIGKRWEDNPRGDLARDIYKDVNFPHTYSYGEMLSYLKYKDACKEAIETFKTAYRTFMKLKKK